MTLYVTISWLSFISILLLIIGLDLSRGSKSKIASLTGNVTILTLAGQVSPYVSSWLPEIKMRDIDIQLMWAGQPYGINAEQYIGIKVIFSILGFMAGILVCMFGLPLIFAVFFAVIGFLIPTLMLRSRAEKRKGEIASTLPNMIGLLSVAVSAGIEMSTALKEISLIMPGALGAEFRYTYKEINTGRPRANAFRDLAKRTGVPIVERFIDTLITAEERGGVNLSEMLTEFNYTIREMNSKKIQEEARKLPTKMQLPLFLCIFGPMLIIILIPVAFTLMEAF